MGAFEVKAKLFKGHFDSSKLFQENVSVNFPPPSEFAGPVFDGAPISATSLVELHENGSHSNVGSVGEYSNGLVGVKKLKTGGFQNGSFEVVKDRLAFL